MGTAAGQAGQPEKPVGESSLFSSTPRQQVAIRTAPKSPASSPRDDETPLDQPRAGHPGAAVAKIRLGDLPADPSGESGARVPLASGDDPGKLSNVRFVLPCRQSQDHIDQGQYTRPIHTGRQGTPTGVLRSPTPPAGRRNAHSRQETAECLCDRPGPMDLVADTHSTAGSRASGSTCQGFESARSWE